MAVVIRGDGEAAPPIHEHRRHRNVRARRWRVAISAVRFAVRIRSAPRANLTVAESNAALELYMERSNEVSSVDNLKQLQSLLFAAGQLVDEDELLDLCRRCGYEEGQTLQFEQFHNMLAIRKRAYYVEQDITDTEAAFRSLMDPETEDISTGRLLALCKDFCLSSEVEQLIEETDADGSGKIEIDEFAALLEPEEVSPLLDMEVSGEEITEASIARSAAHRRSMKQAQTRVYEAFKKRVGFGVSFYGSLRGRLDSNVVVSPRNNTNASAAPRALRPVAPTRSPPRDPLIAATTRVSPSRHRDEHSGQRAGDEVAASSSLHDCRRFGNLVIVQQYQKFAGGVLASRVPIPPPSGRRLFKPKHPETLNGSVERLLTPRSPVSPASVRVPMSQTSAFGTSSGRFDHVVILPLPPPTRSGKLHNREHSSDNCSIYRRGRSPRVSVTAVSPQSSRQSKASPLPLPAIADKATTTSTAPQPVPDYAVFNPFLGLPPPKASSSRPKEAGDALHSPGRPPRSAAGIVAGSTNRHSAANVQLVLQSVEVDAGGSSTSRPSSSRSLPPRAP